MQLVLQIILTLTSLLLILLVLLHKGKGGGLSDLFGGGVSSSLGGSSVVERNLDRLTIGLGIIWIAVDRRPRAAAQDRLSPPASDRRPTLTVVGAVPVADATSDAGSTTWQVVTPSAAAGSEPARWARPSAASPHLGSASRTGAPTVTRPSPSFAEDTQVQAPETWDCPRCGFPAGQDEANPPSPPRTEPYKTHLAYVKERRSDADGAAILEEALAKLRGN